MKGLARAATPLLRIDNLCIAFGARTVVHDLSLTLHAGEKLALVGESGSGKSITALALLGLAQGAHVRGHAWLRRSEGDALPAEDVDLLHCNASTLEGIRGQDIAMVFQEPMTAFNPVMTVGSQIMEVLQLKRGMPEAQAWSQAQQLLADTGVDDPARRLKTYPHQLSGGQRQRAMIAMALAGQPRLLLADEPTTALDVVVRRQILDMLGRLQQQYGMAVVLITHDLPLVRQFADRVAVMEQGRLVEQGSLPSIMHDAQHPYTRKLLSSGVKRQQLPVTHVPADTVVQARQLQVAYAVPRPGLRGWFSQDEFIAVHGADVQVQAGQTLGIIGESGSGKSTLAMALLGLQPSRGDLQVLGQRWGINKSVDRQLRQGIQVVFQDPFASLSPRMTVGEIVTEGLDVHHPHMPVAERWSQAVQALAEVGLSESQFPQLLSRYPHQFSGGQRQRIAIARALVVQPRILVLDEPTSALDVTLAQQILELLQRLQRERGLAYVLITHDAAVIRAMAHHVMVLRQGRVIETGPVDALISAPSQEYTQLLMAAAE